MQVVDLGSMFGGGRERDVVPVRVQAAMAFASMVRSTRLATDNEGRAVPLLQSPSEAGAYNAAMECLKLYFSGEMRFDGEPAAGMDVRDDDAPPQGQGAKANGPAPKPAPAGVA